MLNYESLIKRFVYYSIAAGFAAYTLNNNLILAIISGISAGLVAIENYIRDPLK